MSPLLRVWTHIYEVSKEIDGKMFIFLGNLVMWPLKSIISEKRALFWGFQLTYMGFLRRYIGKCSNWWSWKNEPCSESSKTHLWGFQEDRWENINFSSKPRHVKPQINCLVKTNPVLMVSTHISGNSHYIDGKMFIFQVNLGMWPLKSIVLEKQALFWGFQDTFKVFPRRQDGKTLIFRVNLGMWPLKLIILEKQALFWGFQLTSMQLPSR